MMRRTCESLEFPDLEALEVGKSGSIGLLLLFRDCGVLLVSGEIKIMFSVPVGGLSVPVGVFPVPVGVFHVLVGVFPGINGHGSDRRSTGSDILQTRRDLEKREGTRSEKRRDLENGGEHPNPKKVENKLGFVKKRFG
jgi:hypothetical protein